MEFSVPAKMDQVSETIRIIESTLRENQRLESRDITETLITSEECLVKLIKNAEKDAIIKIRVQNTTKRAFVTLEAEGSIIQVTDKEKLNRQIKNEDFSAKTEDVLRDFLLQSFADKIKFEYKSRTNIVKILVGEPDLRLAINSFFYLLVTFGVGLIFYYFIPDQFLNAISEYVLIPARNLFMNALYLLIEPILFFAIVTCTMRVVQLSDGGKNSRRVFGLYGYTSIVSVVIGCLLGWGAASLIDEGLLKDFVVEGAETVRLFDVIANIMPSNLVKPFLEANEIQLIVLGIIVGIAAGTSNRVYRLKKFFETANDLFSKIAEIITNLVPYFMAISIVILVAEKGPKILWIIAALCIATIIGYLCIAIHYAVLLLFNGINPLFFLRKIARVSIDNFKIGSGIAALPNTMRACRREFGISQKIVDYIIPLGAQFNMDGSNIYLAIGSIFISRVCGADYEAIGIFGFILLTLLMTVGTANIPGSNIIGMVCLLQYAGISIDAAPLIIGLDTILNMIATATNTSGDVLIALITAKQKGELNLEVYNTVPKYEKRNILK